MTERNHARSGFTRIVLTMFAVLGVASARCLADIPIATDSYLIGSDPTQGQYTPLTSLNAVPSTQVNAGFVNGGYTHGTGTANFVISSTGLDYAADGASSTTSGSVFWDGATGTAVKSVARNLSAFNEGTTGTYWTSMLVANVGNTTTTDGYILGGFGNTVAPTLGTTTGNLAGIFFGYSNDSHTVGESDLVLRYRDTTGATSADVQLVNGANNVLAHQTFLVVAQININSNGPIDQVNYWVNPTSLNSLSDLNATSLVSGSVNTYSFQGAASGTGDFTRLNFAASDFNGNAIFDEARLGQTLASIAPPTVPEPAGVVLMAVGGGIVVAGRLWRRRRSIA